MASESYSCLKECFKNVIAEVNMLIKEKKFMAFEREFEIEILIGGDYKVCILIEQYRYLKSKE